MMAIPYVMKRYFQSPVMVWLLGIDFMTCKYNTFPLIYVLIDLRKILIITPHSDISPHLTSPVGEGQIL